MMGLKWCDKNSNCECKDFNEYEIKLNCAKTKLHSRYIAAIAAGIVIWSLATGDANTEEFSAWISFASTIASIILSVIAIILSITGEGKTDVMREKIEVAVRKLEGTAHNIEDANRKSIDNIEELKKEMDELKFALKNIPGETIEKMRTEYAVSNIEVNDSKNSNKGWVNNGK